MSAASPRVLSTPLAEDPVARARAVAPMIEAAAPRIEAERQLPPDLLDAIHGARLVRALLPRAIGGDETTPEPIAG